MQVNDNLKAPDVIEEEGEGQLNSFSGSERDIPKLPFLKTGGHESLGSGRSRSSTDSKPKESRPDSYKIEHTVVHKEKSPKSEDNSDKITEQLDRMLEEELNGFSAKEVARRHLQGLRRFTISNKARWRQNIDLLMSVLLIYVALVIPVRVGFQENVADYSFLHFFEMFIDLMFIVDMSLQFLTTYIDKGTKEEVTELATISTRYLFGWFAIDAVSSIPGSFFSCTIRSGGIPCGDEPKLRMGPGLIFLQVARVTKVIRLIRLANAPVFGTIITAVSSKSNPAFLRIVKLIVLFALAQHFIACSYWLFCSYVDFSTPWALSKATVPKGRTLATLPFQDKYSHAFYWALLVTTNNDVQPTTPGEKWFTSFMLLIGLAINSTIIGSAANLLSNMDRAAVARKEKLDDINMFLRFRKVPPTVQERIRQYYEYLWSTGQTEGTLESIFGDLPIRLKLQLNMTLKRNFIDKVPLFKACSTTGTVELVQSLTPVIVMPGDVIIREGEIGEDFYFINRGSVQVDIEVQGNTIVLGELGEGAFFGEIALLRPPHRRTANIRATTFCELEILSGADFRETAQKFPSLKRVVSKIADSRMRTGLNIQKMTKLHRQETSKFDEQEKVSVPSMINALSLMRRRLKTRNAAVSPGKVQSPRRDVSIYDTVIDENILREMSLAGAIRIANGKSFADPLE